MPHSASMAISEREILESLSPFDISLNDLQLRQIREYLQLLLKWNASINLTAITDPAEIVRRHFGESIFASKLLPVENCRLADVGSGAGFPGLAMKIASPSSQVLLIESNKKKCAFLSEVVRTLRLEGAEIWPQRFEQVRPEPVLANVITARAVGEFNQLLLWSKKALLRRGHIFLWVGAEDSTRISRNANWTWLPAARVPDSQRRFILIGRPIEQ